MKSWRPSASIPPDEAFAAIARHALAAGIGRGGKIGAAESYLFPAPELHRFAESWMEARFGSAGDEVGPSG